MTVIRPNSISGITSITAQANEINVFRSNGLIAGLNLNGVNFNTTAGISTLAALKVTGNLDVEGVLTYQDVTNVDSLGIGTFRTGINVSGGQLDVGSNIKLGNAGVITATSFVGSGAQLTGLPAGTTISGNADNRIITGSGTANTLIAEPNFTWNTQIFYVKSLTNDNPFQLDTGSSNGAHMRFFRDGTQLHFLGCGSGISLGDSEDLSMRSYDNILMSTGNNSTEKLRLDSDGRLIVGGGTHAGGSALVVKGGNQNSYSTIGMFSNHTNPTDNTLLTQIRFGSTATAVGADMRVYADNDWGSNDYPTRMSFYTTDDGSNSRIERLRIDKNGKISMSKNGWVGNDMSYTLTVHTGSTSDSNNAVNDGIMIVSQNNNGNQNSTTGKLMFCGHAQTNGPFLYGKNAQAYGKKDLAINTRSTSNSYSTQLEETARFSYTGALRINKIEPLAGLVSGQMGGMIQLKWSANVDNANYSSTSDVVMQTVNITPTRSEARILIYVCYPSIRSYTTGNTRNRLNHHIKRNGSEIYSLPEMPQWRSANFGSSGVEINKNVNFVTIDSPNTTSQVTYTATWQSVDGHVWNTASAQMTMICAELSAY